MSDARRVYAVLGVPPEIQAYAMARYSRSARSLRESIRELSGQQAAEFLNTFYFQYGHRSIADLAHLAVAIENVSLLAALRVTDEPLWDGQERSTRYQDFEKSGYYRPPELRAAEATQYEQTIAMLMATYRALSDALAAALLDAFPTPEGQSPRAHERTLRARAFDVARGLLPLATHTSLGQVVSARVLERQIARLLADPLPEVRAIGEDLQQAGAAPAYDLSAERIAALLDRLPPDTPDDARAELSELAEPRPPAPTLARHTQPDAYAQRTYAELAAWSATYLELPPPDLSTPVDLITPRDASEETLATLCYRVAGGHSFRQVLEAVRALRPAQQRDLLGLASAHRGPHDELLREHRAGYAFVFDLLVDVGAYRDLHRHRRCVHVAQAIGPDLGWDAAEHAFRLGLGPAAEGALAASLGARYEQALRDAAAAANALPPGIGVYVLPLASRVRALMKMDAAEAAYIVELRTGPGGHFAYRLAAWRMYEALRAQYPELARSVRATDPRVVVDLLRR
ncbi:MAG: FAD-dependent thymidylate synthase [Chloroflexi bacterium]|nr:FAD-dependent thymidylate synthase [Chloroflexota bacterium]